MIILETLADYEAHQYQVDRCAQHFSVPVAIKLSILARGYSKALSGAIVSLALDSVPSSIVLTTSSDGEALVRIVIRSENSYELQFWTGSFSRGSFSVLSMVDIFRSVQGVEILYKKKLLDAKRKLLDDKMAKEWNSIDKIDGPMEIPTISCPIYRLKP